MIIIIVIAVYLIALSITFDNKKSKIRDKNIYIFTYLIFVVIAGLSRNVGEDMVAYLYDYKSCVTWSSSPLLIRSNIIYETYIGMMPFWIISQITFKTFSDSFYLFHFVISSVVNAAFFLTFKKYSNYKYLCLLFYFYYSYYDTNFDLLRQSLACAFGIFAFENLFKNNNFRFYVFSFVALMFHTSAIFLFIIPMLKRFVDKTKFLSSYSYLNLLSLFGITIFLYYFNSIVLFKILAVFQSLSLSRYNAYIENTYNLNGAIFLFVVFLGIPFFIVRLLSKAHLLCENISKILPVYFVVGSFFVSETQLERCFNYFSAFAIVLFVDFFIIFVTKKNLKYKLAAFFLSSLIICKKFTVYDGLAYNTDRHKYEYFIPFTTVLDNDNVKFRETMYYDGTTWRGADLERKQ